VRPARACSNLDDPVAHLPAEFGAHGKQRITLRHVLTHRAGIPHIPPQIADVSPTRAPERESWTCCRTRSRAGSPAGGSAYHALTGGFVLGAVRERSPASRCAT